MEDIVAIRRMLSRRVSQSKKVNSLALKSQLIWTWTIPYLDDFGHYTGDPEDIKHEVFPKNKRITIKDIAIALKRQAGIGLIELYEVNGKVFQEHSGFCDHQTFRSDREKRAEYPSKRNVIPMATIDTPKGSKVKLSKDNISKEKYGDFVLLTHNDFSKLIGEYGKGTIKTYIDRLNNYIGSKGRKYKSHYHVILTWLGKDNIKKVQKKPVSVEKVDLHTRKKVAALVHKTAEKMQ